MIMENEQVNQKPSYEDVVNAYNRVYRELERTQAELVALRQEKVVERLRALNELIANKEALTKNVVSLVNWHLEQILAKPKPAGENQF